MKRRGKGRKPRVRKGPARAPAGNMRSCDSMRSMPGVACSISMRWWRRVSQMGLSGDVGFVEGVDVADDGFGGFEDAEGVADGRGRRAGRRSRGGCGCRGTRAGGWWSWCSPSAGGRSSGRLRRGAAGEAAAAEKWRRSRTSSWGGVCKVRISRVASSRRLGSGKRRGCEGFAEGFGAAGDALAGG